MHEKKIASKSTNWVMFYSFLYHCTYISFDELLLITLNRIRFPGSLTQLVHVHSCYYPIVAILESLSNDDGDGNENGKKQ